MLVFSPAGICKKFTASRQSQPGSLESILQIFSSAAQEWGEPVVWVESMRLRGQLAGWPVLARLLSSLAESLSRIVSDQHQSSQIDLNISTSDPQPAGWGEEIPKTDIWGFKWIFIFIIAGPSFFTMAEIIDFWLWEHSQRRLSSNINDHSEPYISCLPGCS